jgi:transposase
VTRPPDLSRLSEPQKDALIVEQAARLRRAFEIIATLERRIEELEKQLGKPPKTPRNSSTPPSRGRKANAPKRDRKRRRGHPGVARTLAATPDTVVDAVAETCPHSPRRCRRPTTSGCRSTTASRSRRSSRW